MKKSSKFSPEVRERVVRMVQEQRGEYSPLWAATLSIAPKNGCVPQTLLDWVKQAKVDASTWPGISTDEAQRIKDLERDVNRPTAHAGRAFVKRYAIQCCAQVH
jgi:transposase